MFNSVWFQGEVYAFGSNSFGQVDATITMSKVVKPHLVKLSSPARVISTKYFHNVSIVVFHCGQSKKLRGSIRILSFY